MCDSPHKIAKLTKVIERPGLPQRTMVVDSFYHVEQLAKLAAELALRLAALPDNGLQDAQTLDAIEQVAKRVLDQVSTIRKNRNPAVGETRGMWRAMQPIQRP